MRGDSALEHFRPRIMKRIILLWKFFKVDLLSNGDANPNLDRKRSLWRKYYDKKWWMKQCACANVSACAKVLHREKWENVTSPAKNSAAEIKFCHVHDILQHYDQGKTMASLSNDKSLKDVPTLSPLYGWPVTGLFGGDSPGSNPLSKLIRSFYMCLQIHKDAHSTTGHLQEILNLWTFCGNVPGNKIGLL